MFTGIIQEVGTLKKRISTENRYQLVIEAKKTPGNINIGDSVAVNGVCLTVVEYTKSSFTVDVMPETLRATNLKNTKNKGRLNLELAVKPQGFLGGHLVTGHVDGVGKVKNIKSEKNARIMEVAVGKQLSKYTVDKGSVALNGVSLTIVKASEDVLTVSLIPETLKSTNLDGVKVGDEINIETDIIGKYVYKFLNQDKSKSGFKNGISKDFLRENGFL